MIKIQQTIVRFFFLFLWDFIFGEEHLKDFILFIFSFPEMDSWTFERFYEVHILPWNSMVRTGTIAIGVKFSPTPHIGRARLYFLPQTFVDSKSTTIHKSTHQTNWSESAKMVPACIKKQDPYTKHSFAWTRNMVCPKGVGDNKYQWGIRWAHRRGILATWSWGNDSNFQIQVIRQDVWFHGWGHGLMWPPSILSSLLPSSHIFNLYWVVSQWLN